MDKRILRGAYLASGLVFVVSACGAPEEHAACVQSLKTCADESASLQRQVDECGAGNTVVKTELQTINAEKDGLKLQLANLQEKNDELEEIGRKLLMDSKMTYENCKKRVKTAEEETSSATKALVALQKTCTESRNSTDGPATQEGQRPKPAGSSTGDALLNADGGAGINSEVDVGRKMAELERMRAERLRVEKGAVEDQKAALLAHLADVEKTWQQVKPVVDGAGPEAWDALEFFLARYRGNPLGNPREKEARAILDELALAALKQRSAKLDLGTGAMGQFCDKAEVRRKVSKQAMAFRACFARQLQTKPDLGGKVILQWMIDLDGHVVGARPAENETGSQEIGTCVADRVSQIAFEPPKGGVCIVRWPMLFLPEK